MVDVPVLFFTPGTCALACMVALETAGAPYAVCLVTKEERASDAYARFHPRRQVPALRVEGRTLAEVNAILARTADQHPQAGLLPRNGTWERDVANQWLAVLGSGVHPAFWPFYHPERYTTDPAGIEGVKAAAVALVKKELAPIEAHLASSAYLLGEASSALDGYLFAMARWCADMFDTGAVLPNVLRHTRRLATDPIVRRCLAVERGRELPTPSPALAARLRLADLEAT